MVWTRDGEMKMPAYLASAYLPAEDDTAAVAAPQLFIWLMQDKKKIKKPRDQRLQLAGFDV